MGAILVFVGIVILLSSARGDPTMLGHLLINNLTGQEIDRKFQDGTFVQHNGPAILGRVALPVAVLGLVGFYTPAQKFSRAVTILLLVVIVVAVKVESGSNFAEALIQQVKDRPRGKPIDVTPDDNRNPTEWMTDGLLGQANQALQRLRQQMSKPPSPNTPPINGN